MSDINERKFGLPPVYDRHSIVLILGSFPSVKSRAVSFYYGNPQNRFWRMLYGYFGEPISDSTEERRKFLLSHGVALWDMVTSCRIEGSKDTAIRSQTVSDLSALFAETDLKGILLNGATAFRLFEAQYGNCKIPYRKMPSTSPANPSYDEAVWHEALSAVFSASAALPF